MYHEKPSKINILHKKKTRKKKNIKKKIKHVKNIAMMNLWCSNKVIKQTNWHAMHKGKMKSTVHQISYENMVSVWLTSFIGRVLFYILYVYIFFSYFKQTSHCNMLHGSLFIFKKLFEKCDNAFYMQYSIVAPVVCFQLMKCNKHHR